MNQTPWFRTPGPGAPRGGGGAGTTLGSPQSCWEPGAGPRGDFLPRIRARSSRLPLDPSPRIPASHGEGSFRPGSEKPPPVPPAGCWALRAAVPSDPEAARSEAGMDPPGPARRRTSPLGSEPGRLGSEYKSFSSFFHLLKPELRPRLESVPRGHRGPAFSCREGAAQGRGRPRSPVRVSGAVLPPRGVAIQWGPWWQRPGEEEERMGPAPLETTPRAH